MLVLSKPIISDTKGLAVADITLSASPPPKALKPASMKEMLNKNPYRAAAKAAMRAADADHRHGGRAGGFGIGPACGEGGSSMGLVTFPGATRSPRGATTSR